MSLSVNTNLSAINTLRDLQQSTREQAVASERLSSGKRINSAKDDAAGLQISNNMTSQIRGLDQAVRNANDGISMIQIAESGLQQTNNSLQRMRELAIQSANGTYNDNENRAALNAEFQQLLAEVDRISVNTKFNGQSLLNGEMKSTPLQVGANANETVDFQIEDMSSRKLGLGGISGDLTGDQTTLTDSNTNIGFNDVLINGQSVIKQGQTAITTESSPDELINAINANVNGVTAEYVVSNKMPSVGTGLLSGSEELIVTLTMPDLSQQMFTVRDTNNLIELSDKINKASNGMINSHISDDGDLSINAVGVYRIELDAPDSVLYEKNMTLENLIDVDNPSFESDKNGWNETVNPLNFSSNYIIDSGTGGVPSTDGDKSLRIGIIGYPAINGSTSSDNIISNSFSVIAGDQLIFDINELYVDAGDSFLFTATLTNNETGETVLYQKNDNSLTINSHSDNLATIPDDWSNILLTSPWSSNDVTIDFDIISSDGSGNSYTDSYVLVDNVRINRVLDSNPESSYAEVTLTSNNGYPITVERGTTGTYTDLSALGFRESTNPSTIEGYGITSASTPWNAGDVTINGVTIEDRQPTSSLLAKVDAINKVFSQTGVRAETFVSAEIDMSDINLSGGSAGLTINGVVIDTGATTLEELTADINEKTENTGIVAVLSGQTIQLEGNSASLNVAATSSGTMSASSITYTHGNVTTTETLPLITASSVQISGGFKLTSIDSNPISIELGDYASAAEHGLKEQNAINSVSSGSAIQRTSIDTSDKAQRSILSIDNAIQSVDRLRGELGALHNRIEMTIDSLMNTSQYTSATRSRITDTDFAKESASLSRSQIIQQASATMLGQANALPQQVLQLLQN